MIPEIPSKENEQPIIEVTRDFEASLFKDLQLYI